MRRVFITSDNHFGHENFLSFKDDDNRLIRGATFSSMEEMDEVMIDRWNSIVLPEDKVYHLGDFTLSQRPNDIAYYRSRLNGNIVLIRGNHDKAKLNVYAKNFKDVRSSHLLETNKPEFTHLLLTHIPVHPMSLPIGWVNVHGHIHAAKTFPGRYHNVSVETTDYYPVEFNQLINIIMNRYAEGELR